VQKEGPKNIGLVPVKSRVSERLRCALFDPKIIQKLSKNYPKIIQKLSKK
jgi:hypothetical protein